MTINRAEIAAKILERLDIKIDKDDPAFLLVELNVIAFEDLIEPIAQKLKQSERLPDNINKSAAKIQSLVDQLNISKELIVAEIAASSRTAIKNDIQEIINNATNQLDQRIAKVSRLSKITFASSIVLLIGTVLMLAKNF